MKQLRITLAALIAIICFAFTRNNEAIQTPCEQNLHWFLVYGYHHTQNYAISNLIPVFTTFGDTTPNEVPSGTRNQILLSGYPYCEINEIFFCAIGYHPAQLEVKEIPTGSGHYCWIPKPLETPKCSIYKME